MGDVTKMATAESAAKAIEDFRREAPLAVPEPEYQDETDPNVKTGWHIETLPSMEWALSRVADLESEITENDASAAKAMQRIEERLKAINAKAMRGVNFFRFRVLEFMERHRAELLKGGKKKSRTCIYGTVGWRKKGGRLKVIDAEALAAWAQSRPVEEGAYRVKIEPEMKVIQEIARRENLIPPGTEWDQERDEPFVEAIAPTTTLVKE